MQPRLKLLTITLIIVIAVASITYYGLMSQKAPNRPATISYSPTLTISSQSTGDWPTYHKDPVRSGFEPDINAFSSVHLNWRSIRLDGDVYAEPLIVGKSVIVATENNSLCNLDADTGQVIWRTNLGMPVRGSELPCGDVDPSGITGTPAVDLTRNYIYAVAFLDSPPHHELFAVDLTSGGVKFHVPIDAPNADPKVHQQRAALAFSKDYIYVCYGGLAGDCGDYHGQIVACQADGEGEIISYQVPSEREAGIWAPAGPAVNNLGEIYVTTGNSASDSAFDYGNTVIKLSPDLKPLSWFAPKNWIQLNSEDSDLGSTGPVILNSDFIFQIGKDGIGYLLDAENLGGVGGQIFSTQVCAGPYAGAYGALAYSPPYLFVPCSNGVVALQMNLESKSFTVLWRGPNFTPGPPVVAGNAVWTTDVSKGLIYALDVRNGSILFQDAIGSVTRFTSIGVGDGQIIISANQEVIAYLPQTISTE